VFVQSRVPEHAELHLLLAMVTPVAWLERVPSYKDLQAELTGKDLSTYGFLGYPLLQTADVAIYGGTHVPVGADQVAHIELSREVVRRFNNFYGEGLLPEPLALLTPVPKLPGTDGRKMSKSYHNALLLSEPFADITQKVLTMVTDPARKRRTDKGNPDICPVFDYHKIYSTRESQDWAAAGCRSAGIGCIDCKKKMLSHMGERLLPYQEKRAEIAARRQDVDDTIASGVAAARAVAGERMVRIRQALQLL
jgi:tryptophanyl-tRNA synthetase